MVSLYSRQFWDWKSFWLGNPRWQKYWHWISYTKMVILALIHHHNACACVHNFPRKRFFLDYLQQPSNISMQYILWLLFVQNHPTTKFIKLQNHLSVDPGKVLLGYVPVWMIHQTATTFKLQSLKWDWMLNTHICQILLVSGSV